METEFRVLVCPNMQCRRSSVLVLYAEFGQTNKGRSVVVSEPTLAYPWPMLGMAAPAEVTGHLRNLYEEARAIIAVSHRGAAALLRRCLHDLIVEKEGVTEKNLDAAIQAALEKGKYPASLAQDLQAVRIAGNFAAHSMRDSDGEVVDVEPVEAEAVLAILFRLFNFYFVEPARSAELRASLNQKLRQTGKREIDS